MERSALARNLKRIARKRLVEASQGQDKRTGLAHLAPVGKRKLDEALTHWKRAQNELATTLGPD